MNLKSNWWVRQFISASQKKSARSRTRQGLTTAHATETLEVRQVMDASFPSQIQGQDLIIPIWASDQTVLTGYIENDQGDPGRPSEIPDGAIFISGPTGTASPIGNPRGGSSPTYFSPTDVIPLSQLSPTTVSTTDWSQVQGYAALTPLNGSVIEDPVYHFVNPTYQRFQDLAWRIANSIDDISISRYGVNVKAPLSLYISPEVDPANATFFTSFNRVTYLSGQLSSSLQGLWPNPAQNGAEPALRQISDDLGQTISAYNDLRANRSSAPIRLSEDTITKLAEDVTNVWEHFANGINAAGESVDWYLSYLHSTTQRSGGQVSPFLQKLTPALDRLASVANAVGLVEAQRDITTLAPYLAGFPSNPRPMTTAEAQAALGLITQAISATPGLSLPVRAVLVGDSLLSLVPEYQQAKNQLVVSASGLVLPDPPSPGIAPPAPPSDSSGVIHLGNLTFSVAVNHPPAAVENYDYPREVAVGSALRFRPKRGFADPDHDHDALKLRVTSDPTLGIVKWSKDRRDWVYVPMTDKIGAAPLRSFRVPGTTSQMFAVDSFEMTALDSTSADGQVLSARRSFFVRIEWQDGQLQDSRFRVFPSELANEQLLLEEPANPNALPTPTAANVFGSSFALGSSWLALGASSVRVDFAVTNSGGLMAAPVRVNIYLSQDNSIGTDDRLLDSVTFTSIAASATAYGSRTLTLPQLNDPIWQGPGQYTIGMRVDAVNEVPESNESDNSNRGQLLDLQTISFSNGTADVNAQPGVNGTIMVTSTANAGPGSLREAILTANVVATRDVVQFAIPGTNRQTIFLTEPLPEITQPIWIVGTSQDPNWVPGIAPITLDGRSAGISSGLRITGGQSIIQGLAIVNFQGDGIQLLSSGNLVHQSLIGTDNEGHTGIGNSGNGVLVFGTNNIVGSSLAAAGNTIAGNGRDGVLIFGSTSGFNRVDHNFIGTDPRGERAVANGLSGVHLLNTPNNSVLDNVISGNTGDGVFVDDNWSNNNEFLRNRIGTDVSGQQPLGNGGNGIRITHGQANRIGHAGDYGRNIVSANRQNGISLENSATETQVSGNYVGLNRLGSEVLGNFGNGIAVINSAGNRIGGLTPDGSNVSSGNGGYGVFVSDANSAATTIRGNVIGLDVTQSIVLGNRGGGVLVGNTHGVTVGGVETGDLNVIAGNAGPGVQIFGAGGSDVSLIGNYIGTNRELSPDLGNVTGVLINNTPRTFVSRNVICGNSGNGVELQGSGYTTETRVSGNFIGVDLSGEITLANGGDGIRVAESIQTLNTIGSLEAGEGNVIAANRGAGVRNFGQRTRIVGNSFFDNEGLGIDLGTDGATANDTTSPADSDEGANRLQNSPVIVSATSGDQLTIEYSVPTDELNASFPLRIEFYLTDANGDEGRVLLGADTYSTAEAMQSVTLAISKILTSGDRLTAIATDVDGNSSEFSAAVSVTVATDDDIGLDPVEPDPPTEPPSLAGDVFDDVNSDGIRDDNESLLPGIVVFVDLNHNEQWDDNEPNTSTDEQGAFAFFGLEAGTYFVRVVAGEGVEQTTQTEPASSGTQVAVLSSGNTLEDETVLGLLTNRGFDVTLTDLPHQFAGDEIDLSQFDAVVLLNNYNWASGSMPNSGQSALSHFVLAGGGLVTVEWELWNTYHGSGNSGLEAIFPAREVGYDFRGTSTTYTRAVTDSVLDREMPESFSFAIANLGGTESFLEAKPGATAYYTSSNTNRAGLVGWNVPGGNGRVISFSTLGTPTELSNPDYARLFANSVSWVAPAMPSGAAVVTVGTDEATTIHFGLHEPSETVPIVTLQSSIMTVAEAGGAIAEFVVSRGDSPLDAPLTVRYEVTGTAANGGDFLRLNGEVTIEAGEESARITLTPTDDTLIEDVEDVTLTLLPDAAYDLGDSMSASVEIVSEDHFTVSVGGDSEVAEAGHDPGVFVINRSGASFDTPLLVDYELSGTAINGEDFESLTGTVLIEAGQSFATVSVQPINDDLIESLEDVTLTLLSSDAYDLSDAPSASLGIISDDHFIVSLVAVDAEAAEAGGNPAVFEISRRGASLAEPLLVDYELTGSAANGEDFEALTGTVLFEAGQASATITLQPIDDRDIESLEDVTLTLLASGDYELDSETSATATIESDDRNLVTLEATDSAAAEADRDPATFVVRRQSNDLSSPLLVAYSIAGTATNGADFENLSGTVTIPAGAAFTTITLKPIDDTFVELPEDVTLTLSPNAAYELSTATQATATITSNDQYRVTLTASDRKAAEANRDPATFVIRRSGASLAEPLTVSYAMSGDAINGSDYESLSGTAVIPAGSASTMITLRPIDDTLFEKQERATLTLSDSSRYIVDRRAETVTIDSNDIDTRPTLSLQAVDAVASETRNDTGTFRVTRTGNLSREIVVRYAIGGSATNGVDYESLTGMVVLAAGQSSVQITLRVIDDRLVERTEDVVLTLLDDPAYLVSRTRQATVRIQSDDVATPVTLRKREVAVSDIDRAFSLLPVLP